MSETKAPTPPLSTLLAILLWAAACSSTEKVSRSASTEEAGGAVASHGGAASSSIPWTDAFTKPAVLIAADVRIEGPKGLMDHIATVSDPEELERTEKTVPEGFLQEVSVKPAAAGAEIKAQLDRLAIVATRRLVILERPGLVDVIVVAQGDVYWASQGSGEEKRGESLRFVGTIAR